MDPTHDQLWCGRQPTTVNDCNVGRRMVVACSNCSEIAVERPSNRSCNHLLTSLRYSTTRRELYRTSTVVTERNEWLRSFGVRSGRLFRPMRCTVASSQSRNDGPRCFFYGAFTRARCVTKGGFRGAKGHAPKMPNIVQHDTETTQCWCALQ